MASAKLATLIIRTLAKPISSQIKEQVRQHERFRTLCVDLAQFMYRSEVKLRTNILGEPARLIRPLSEAKAIDNGANALAEGFLFTVAAALIIGETWRSSRNSSKRRDSVDDQLEDLGTRLAELTTRVDTLVDKWEDERGQEKQRNDELSRILERIVEIGLRGGWAEFQDSPVQLPRVYLAPGIGPGTGLVTHGHPRDSSLAAVAEAVEGAEARVNVNRRGSGEVGVSSIGVPPRTQTQTQTPPSTPAPTGVMMSNVEEKEPSKPTSSNSNSSLPSPSTESTLEPTSTKTTEGGSSNKP